MGFSERVYFITRQIPEGRVATYGQIALYAGSPRAARAVGSLMKASGRNGVEVPWQRVINARGAISFKGDLARAELQRELLEREGVVFDDRGRCELDVYGWEPEEFFWIDE